MHFTIYDPNTGRIVCTLLTSDGHIAPDFLAERGVALQGTFDGSTYWVDSGEPALRPTLALPAAHTMAVHSDWTIPDAPAGTEVEVDGSTIGVVDQTGLTLSFDTTGVWPVTLRPPFPWVEAICEVTVQ